eukprot:593521-Amphidinium_carterae.1
MYCRSTSSARPRLLLPKLDVLHDNISTLLCPRWKFITAKYTPLDQDGSSLLMDGLHPNISTLLWSKMEVHYCQYPIDFAGPNWNVIVVISFRLELVMSGYALDP